MAALLHTITWGCLSHPSYHNPCFDVVFTSEDVFVSVFDSAGFEFAPDLLLLLEDGEPDIEWFQSRSLDVYQDRALVPCKRWGIYLHVYTKDGHLPLLYCGSATSEQNGLSRRLDDYWRLHNISQSIHDALNAGFVLGYTVILGHCPIPIPSARPRIRALCLALEAAFSAIFWCMGSKTADYGHLGAHAVWGRDELPWGGLCTHSPLLKKIEGLELTAEELDAVNEARRVQTNIRNSAWARANNAKNRANPTPEFAAWRTRHNARKYVGKKRKRDEAVANRTHYCVLCEKTYTSRQELENHKQTRLHLKREARGSKDWPCEPCGKTFPNKTRFDRHRGAKSCRRNIH